MSKLGWLERGLGYAGAPWTGGTSIMIGNAAANATEAHQAANAAKKTSNANLPGGTGPLAPYTDILSKNATGAQAQGESAMGTGMDAMAPVLKYLQSILGGDPQALLAATQPERGRVIDQYDTARRNAAEFGPRGGGTTGALASSRFQQAQSLSDITSSTRRDAAATEGVLGAQLAQIGLTSEQLATTDLNDVITAALGKSSQDLTRRGQNMEALTGVGQTAGTLLGLYLTRDKNNSGGGGTVNVGQNNKGTF